MKKLAGRDFKDILQVSAAPSLSPELRPNITSFSVGCQCWKAFCQTLSTTRSYSTSPLISPLGMPTRSSACTQHTQLLPFELRPKNSAVCFVSTPTNCVPNTQRNCCQGKQPPPIVTKPPAQRPRRPLPLLGNPRHHPRRVFPKAPASISRRTRSTRLGITRITLSNLAQRTVSPHTRYAPSPLSYPFLTCR